jgi:hypothetical protein
MMRFINSKEMRVFVFALNLFAGTTSIAAYSKVYNVGWGGNYHSHDGGYGHGSGGYYDRGGFYFGGGWGGPNVVINVPVQPYYAPPICETVQVCDNYRDECWLEQRCV